MKKLLKREVCGSREQCTGPIGVTPQPHNTQKKKKKKRKRANTEAFLFIRIQTQLKCPKNDITF